MIKLDTKPFGFDELERDLDDADRRQIPYAAKAAINDTLAVMKEEGQRELMTRLDSPIRWTRNSLVSLRASKRRLSGSVWFKDEVTRGTPAGEYLRPLIEGGARPYKDFERLLYRIGVLPRGYYAVPARGMRLNRHGNISAGMHTKILSDLRALEEFSGYTANRRQGNVGKFFVPRRGHTLPLGIYRRNKRGVKAIFIFVKKKPQYKKVLRLLRDGTDGLRRELRGELQQGVRTRPEDGTVRGREPYRRTTRDQEMNLPARVYVCPVCALRSL